MCSTLHALLGVLACTCGFVDVELTRSDLNQLRVGRVSPNETSEGFEDVHGWLVDVKKVGEERCRKASRKRSLFMQSPIRDSFFLSPLARVAHRTEQP